MKEKDRGQHAEYMMIYVCSTCGLDSAFTETEKPVCRYCDEPTEMKLISKEKITPELIEKRLKASTERMLSNLQSAFESMTVEDKAAFGDQDAEKEMLLLLAKAKELKEKIAQLKLEDPDQKQE